MIGYTEIRENQQIFFKFILINTRKMLTHTNTKGGLSQFSV